MSRIITKKRALIVAAVTSLTLVAVAIAYYTTLGEGTGEGTVDSAYAANLVIEGDIPESGLVVPGSAVTLTGTTVTNPATNEGDARATTVEATDINAGGDDEAGPDTCDDDWFSIADVAVNDNLAPGETVSFTAVIEMSNPTDVSQDACKGDAITIEWDSDATE